MDPIIAIVLIIAALAAGVGVGYALFYKKGVEAGVEKRKRDAEAIVGSAEQQAERIVEDAEKVPGGEEADGCLRDLLFRNELLLVGAHQTLI